MDRAQSRGIASTRHSGLGCGVAFGVTGLWASSAGDVWASDSAGELLRTRDHGRTWTVTPAGPGPLLAVGGAGPDDIYAVGEVGAIVRVRDGGRKVDARPSPVRESLRAVWAGGEVVYVIGGAGAVPIADGRTLVIKRVYKAALLEDPDQGKDQGVWLAEGGGKLEALAESCSPAEAFAAREGKLAFQCGDSVAADELLHKVLVFDGDKQVAAVSSCRKPRWTGPAVLVCSSESVGPDGKIKLKAKKVLLGR